MANEPENTNAAAPQNATPDASAEKEGRQSSPTDQQPAAGTAPGTPSESTQSSLGDGAGIRGSYGDASQTNGLEGGPDSDADGSPKGQ